MRHRERINAHVVQELCLARSNLSDADVALLCQGVRALPCLRKLDLSRNAALTWRAAAALSQMLDGRPVARRQPPHVLAGPGVCELQELHLDGSQIRDAGAAYLLPALCSNAALRTLSLCDCGIGGAAVADHFRAVVFQNAHLQTLLLAGNRCSLLAGELQFLISVCVDLQKTGAVQIACCPL